MTRFRTLFLAPLMLVATMAFASAAYAGPAQDHVRDKHSVLIAQLKNPPSAARTRRIEALLDELLDFDKIATDSLGRHAEGRSEAELSEFRDLLKALVKQSYRKNIQKSADYELEYLGETPTEPGIIVRTKVKKKDSSEEPVEINYFLRQVKGKWLIYDVETEGSRMVRNYRSQFNRVINRDGFGTLLTKLRTKRDARDTPAARDSQ